MWRLHEHPLLVDIAAWTCIGVFAAAFCLTAVVIGRAGLLIDRADEKSLGWSERQGRKNARFNRFLVDPEYRTLRRMLYAAWGGAILSFASLFLIVAIFGERVPR